MPSIFILVQMLHICNFYAILFYSLVHESTILPKSYVNKSLATPPVAPAFVVDCTIKDLMIKFENFLATNGLKPANVAVQFIPHLL